MKEGEKYFLVPEGHEMLTGYSSALDEMANAHHGKDVFIEVKPSVVEAGDISMIVAMVAAAQHKKKWIEHLLFNLSFNFLREEYSEKEYLTIDEWCGSRAYQNWFCTMNKKMPMSIFFLKSDDARLLSVQGDFLSDMLMNYKERKGDKVSVDVPVDKLELIDNRLFWSCISFYTYCSGMHVKAKEYIEALLAEQRAHFEFKHVHKDWLRSEYKMKLH
jgi:hypothetical protein